MAGPVDFGFKMAWLAVRGVDPERALAAVGVGQVEASPWPEGIEALYAASPGAGAHPVFATPPLDGWVLVASPAFFDEASDAEPERLSRFVTELSARLDAETQFFATHRVVEGHAWVRATAGTLERAFFYLGEIDEVLLDEGPPTSGEEEAGLPAADLADEENRPDEQTVTAVAAAWSLDPTSLASRFPDAADGWIGSLDASGGQASASGDVASASRDSASVSGPDADPPAPADERSPRPWWKFW